MEQLGGYRVLERLGVGGEGEVYLARRESAGGFGRPCVLKTIRARSNANNAARRFLHEAQLAIQLNHKNICGVTDVGEHEHGFFLAMDYIAGRDLRDVLKALHAQGRRVTPPLALYLLRELLDGLDYAHRAVNAATGQPLHLVHRDITPSNVMISFEGEVKIIDFGAATSSLKGELTVAGVVHGKLGYLSPEQARGEPLDGRSDLYSAGILATELLTGAPYYGGIARPQMMALVQRGHLSPLLAALDGDIRDLLGLALEPDRALRTPTAEQMRTRVERLLVKRQAVVGPVDLRRLMVELFPGDLEKQRARLARVSGEEQRTPTSMTPEPESVVLFSRLEAGVGEAPGALRELTEIIPTRLLSGTEPLPIEPAHGAAITRLAGLAGLCAVLVVAGILWWRGGGEEARAAVAELPRAADAGTAIAVAPRDAGASAPPDAGAATAPGVLDAGAPDAPAVQPLDATLPTEAGGRPKGRPRVKPTSTADKLKWLERCKQQRCASSVLDRYARFATLSVDEARGLAAELDACVKRCGG